MSKLKPNFTPTPNIFFDVMLSDLGHAETKCLLYIFRRTYGFQKESDKISLTQFEEGIKDRNGNKLDNGTGLKRPNIVKALNSLSKNWGIVLISKKGNINEYSLNLSYEKELVTQSNHTSNVKLPELVTQSNIQKKEKESYQKKDIVKVEKIPFQEFWKLYPVKKSKKVSEQKWNKLPHETQLIIIEDIQKRVHDTQWKQGYIPHASTYINQERWEDEITINSPNTKSKSIGIIGFN